MEELRPLTEADETIVKEYLDRYYIECTYIVDSFERYGLNNRLNYKKSGSYYGYFIGHELKGIFVFQNIGVLSCHYESGSVLNKLDLLHVIKKHKPVHVIGPKEYVMPLMRTFDKVFRWEDTSYCKFMLLDIDSYSSDINEEHEIVNAVEFDFKSSLEFLIKMESDFRRKTKTINDFKNYIYDKDNHLEYIYITRENRTIAQGLIKTCSDRIEMIEGIYTLDEYRNMGYAKTIISELCDRVIMKSKQPGLIVAEVNNNAIKLYEKIGFRSISEFITANISYI